MENKELRIEPAYRTGTHPNSFRSGKQALITGVVLVNGRPNFVVLYEDGTMDYEPIEDYANYKIGRKMYGDSD